MTSKEHLGKEGFNKIAALKGVMNKKLKEELKIAFPDHIPLIQPSYLEHSACYKDVSLLRCSLLSEWVYRRRWFFFYKYKTY